MCSIARKAAIALIVVCAALLSAQVVAKKTPVLMPNRVQISYVEPRNPAHQKVYELLKERRVLERVRAHLSPLRLPTTLILKADGCDGESDAWYEESDHTVTVCYEYIDDLVRNAPEATTVAGVTRYDAIVGPTIEVLLHEVGHAIFHLLKVPILGREEDAADQFASYMILHLDEDSTRQVVLGVGYMYGHEMQSQTPGLQQFANVHSVAAQRFYNVLCMAYGRDPSLFGYVVERGYLPEARAETCGDEYKQVDYAVRKLIHPYIDQALARKVRPEKLMRPVER